MLPTLSQMAMTLLQDRLELELAAASRLWLRAWVAWSGCPRVIE